VVWQFIMAEHFHPWNSLPVNAGVLWWCTETTAFRETVQRVQEWVGINHEDYTFQTGRSRTCVHSASGGPDFGKPSRQFQICPLHWSDLWKVYPKLSMYKWDTAVCVCAWWVPRYVMEVHENWCLEVIFHFFSHLKEWMGSLNPWWHCETMFHYFLRNKL